MNLCGISIDLGVISVDFIGISVDFCGIPVYLGGISVDLGGIVMGQEVNEVAVGLLASVDHHAATHSFAVVVVEDGQLQ